MPIPEGGVFLPVGAKWDTQLVKRVVSPKKGPNKIRKISCASRGRRFSGGSHGFMVGHITTEAFGGGPLAIISLMQTLYAKFTPSKAVSNANPRQMVIAA